MGTGTNCKRKRKREVGRSSAIVGDREGGTEIPRFWNNLNCKLGRTFGGRKNKPKLEKKGPKKEGDKTIRMTTHGAEAEQKI